MAFSVDDIAIAPWKYWAQVSPFSIALETNKASLNWQQLAARINHYVHSLQQQGVMNGDVVTLVGKNQVETLWFYLAAQQLGATVALTMPQPFEALSGKLTTLYKPNQQRFVWFADGAVGLYSENQLSQLSATLLSIPDIDTDDVSVLSTDGYSHDGFASIVFTSGSTGTPKAVVHTHRQHLSSAQGLLAEFRFDQQDTWLLSLPLYHVSGLAIVYRWLFAGATIKVGSGSLADDIVGVSHASLVSTQLKRLLDEQVELSLTHVLLGGSHVAHELALRATQQGIETWLGYGMTEAASTVTAKQIDSISNAGHLLQNRDIKLEEQRIYIGGLTLATGYFNQGSITSLLNDDGWFDSKDLGEWQGDELKIIGRADNQFISGGENAHCEEIEAVLNQIEGISQSIVVPVEDAEFGHRPVAVIQTESLLSKVQYEQYLKTKLEKFKWPVAYYAMPQTLLGGGIKVSRKAVKDWLKNEVQNGD
ncbi:o-succinylbenzoate--CoA ligase [Vibrio harveyi]|uniref:o-succinylbenzoate--CoA ligase n=1 Tax=Vibrio harveyi TaxID=669 RepID=UPI001EFDFFA7|nr:o-succinylbenzoate--CoA ligase [Vibrio harveyi]MCG9235917.1 o-succinylbenzoate--CoA ligase [Vibrio harveyi]MCG9586693.1 o-succinylbenzoate--CoA ligase [Vibrio harveyi]CAH1198610.1 o-succinylbenzoate--CoA ligase [Vibrio harveyi]CAH1550271.1 o-succinylbenzoate--CoA ligase [Vibrio harveyi]CAH1556255.1 o-succinylbenzoate--CoA ligase [Vibrio harveyi]